MNWAQQRRHAFIEFWCWKTGTFNRQQLTAHFGITVTVASRDIKTYRERYPAQLIYDRRAKTYRTTEHFQPKLIDAETLKPPYCAACWGTKANDNEP